MGKPACYPLGMRSSRLLRRLLLLLAVAILHAVPRAARPQSANAPMSTASEEALQKTQDLLRDPAARKQAIQEKASAKAADDQAAQVAGSEANKDEMYALASEIMETVTRLSGGDTQKMTALLAEAASNPAAFAAKLPPDQQAKLKSLAEKAEKTKAAAH